MYKTLVAPGVKNGTAGGALCGQRVVQTDRARLGRAGQPVEVERVAAFAYSSTIENRANLYCSWEAFMTLLTLYSVI